MRTSLPAKAPAAAAFELHPTSRPSLPLWPGDSYALRKAPIQTALEIQFRGVENLIRTMEGLTWTRGRRRR